MNEAQRQHLIQHLEAGEDLNDQQRQQLVTALGHLNLAKTAEDVAGEGYLVRLAAKKDDGTVTSMAVAFKHPDPAFLAKFDALADEFYS